MFIRAFLVNRIKVILFIIFFIFSCGGCALNNLASGSLNDEITYYAGDLGGEPWGIRSSIYSKGVIYRNVFTQGVYLDENSQLLPGLFSSWESDENKKTYTVKLASNYTYSDGTPVALKDIEFLYIKIFLTEEEYPVFPFQKNLKGSELLSKGSTFKSGMCKCISIDGDKMTFHLKIYDPFFLHKLSHYIFPVAPIDSFDADLFSFKGLPLGSGPYEIVSYDKAKGLTELRLRDRYFSDKNFNGAPSKIHFYNSGKATSVNPDISYESSLMDKSNQYRKVIGKVPDSLKVINFNFENKFGKNIHFRKAVSLAIDRDELTNESLENQSAYGLLLNEDLGIKEPSRAFNIKESRRIVAKHFSGVSSRSAPLKALYYGSSSEDNFVLYSLIEKQLADVGLYIHFQSSNFSELQKGKNHDFVFVALGKFLPYHDYIYPFFVYSGVDQGMVNSDPANDDFRKLYQQVIDSDDLAKQKILVGQLSVLHAENYIQVPLFKSYPVLVVKETISKVMIDNPLSLVEFWNVR
jgi:ABC-type transport system substrate-binding protein